MSELQEQTSREALHQRIIDVAGEEFRKHGIRSVRMDDLSSLLGISKRTLYEEFEDKEAVLTAVFDHQIRKMEAVYAKNREESANVLEFVLRMFRISLTEYAQTNPKYFDDMQRYPKFKECFEEGKVKHMQNMKVFLTQGMEQGIFRSDLNVELFVKVQQLIEEKGLKELKELYGMYETFKTTVLVALRGISTEKGIQMIDDFMIEMNRKKE